MKAREGKVRFGLDSRGAQAGKASLLRIAGHNLDQRRLADAGVAAKDQLRARRVNAIEQPADRSLLGIATEQPRDSRAGQCALRTNG